MSNDMMARAIAREVGDGGEAAFQIVLQILNANVPTRDTNKVWERGERASLSVPVWIVDDDGGDTVLIQRDWDSLTRQLVNRDRLSTVPAIRYHQIDYGDPQGLPSPHLCGNPPRNLEQP